MSGAWQKVKKVFNAGKIVLLPAMLRSIIRKRKLR